MCKKPGHRVETCTHPAAKLVRKLRGEVKKARLISRRRSCGKRPRNGRVPSRVRAMLQRQPKRTQASPCLESLRQQSCDGESLPRRAGAFHIQRRMLLSGFWREAGPASRLHAATVTEPASPTSCFLSRMLLIADVSVVDADIQPCRAAHQNDCHLRQDGLDARSKDARPGPRTARPDS